MMQRERHPPKPDCSRCKGTGKKKVKIGSEGHYKETDCIYTYVNHKYSEEIGDVLQASAKRQLKRIKEYEERGETLPEVQAACNLMEFLQDVRKMGLNRAMKKLESKKKNEKN